MKVWVAMASDRYYDDGSDWLIGIYSSEGKAEIAEAKEKEDFIEKNSQSWADTCFSTWSFEVEVE